MATIIILLGGILGFVTGITAYVSYDSGLVTALLIWAVSGPMSAMVVIMASLRTAAARAAPGHHADTKTA